MRRYTLGLWLVLVFLLTSGYLSCGFGFGPAKSANGQVRARLEIAAEWPLAMPGESASTESARLLLPSYQTVRLQIRRESSGELLHDLSIELVRTSDQAAGTIRVSGTSPELVLPMGQALTILATVSEGAQLIAQAQRQMTFQTNMTSFTLGLLPTEQHPNYQVIALGGQTEPLFIGAEECYIIAFDALAGLGLTFELELGDNSGQVLFDLYRPDGLRQTAVVNRSDTRAWISTTTAAAGRHYLMVYNLYNSPVSAIESVRLDYGQALPGMQVTTLAGQSYYDVTGGLYNVPEMSIDGDRSTARFYHLGGAAEHGGYVYVTDWAAHVIRRVDPTTGAVVTVAGSRGVSGTLDGNGSAARFNQPRHIVSDGTYLYIADMQNHSIRRFDPPSGGVQTVVGLSGTSGTEDASGPDARFTNPYGLVYDNNTNILYVSQYVESGSEGKIRAVDPVSRAVTTLTASHLNLRLAGLALGYDGYIYSVANNDTDPVRKTLLADGSTSVITTTLGTTQLQDIFYFADSFWVSSANGQLWKMNSSGDTEVMADGSSGSHTLVRAKGAKPAFGVVMAIGRLSDGRLLLASDAGTLLAWNMNMTALFDVLAGSPPYDSFMDGVGPAARIGQNDQGYGVAADANRVWFTAGNTIRVMDIATRAVTTLAGMFDTGSGSSIDGSATTAKFSSPQHLALAGDYLYVVEQKKIRKVHKESGETVTLTDFSSDLDVDFRGVASDGTWLYATDKGKYCVWKISLADGSGSILAGSGEAGTADGAALSASFSDPLGIVFNDGVLYLTDSNPGLIRRVNPTTGSVATLAGRTGGEPGSSEADNGYGTDALFDQPAGIAADGNFLYVAENGRGGIRIIDKLTWKVSDLLAGRWLGDESDPDAPGLDAYFDQLNTQLAYNGTDWYLVDGARTLRRLRRN